MKKLITILTALAMLLSMVCLSGCAQEEAAGKVFFLNMSQEDDETWQMLAQVYAETTGVEVKVRTVAPEDYQTELIAAMCSDWAPSLFQCVDEMDLQQWTDYALDLSDSVVRQACDSRGFLLRDGQGKVRGIGYTYAVYGIVVNTQLLEQAGYSLEDITDFESLKAVAEDITRRQKELKFGAFAAAGVDNTMAQQMANLPLYYKDAQMETFRNLWDLYLNNHTAADLGETSAVHGYNTFVDQKAVFYQSDAAVYDRLVAAGMDPEMLTMIPLYCGASGEEDAGLCCGTEDYLTVNAKAPEADRRETLEFLEWLSTSRAGLELMRQRFGGVSFQGVRPPENGFFRDAGKLYEEEKYTVTWKHVQVIRNEKWEEQFLPALRSYSLDQGDWAAVEAAFESCK